MESRRAQDKEHDRPLKQSSVVIVPTLSPGQAAVDDYTFKSGTSTRGAFAGTGRNYLLAGGNRTLDTQRATALANVNAAAIRDIKAANETLASELTRQRHRHEKETAELKQQLAKAVDERNAEHASNDQKREEKLKELVDKEAATSKLSHHVMDLQHQLEIEQQLRLAAEESAVLATRKWKSYKKRMHIATEELEAKNAHEHDLADIKARCQDLQARLQSEELRQQKTIANSDTVKSLEAELSGSKRHIASLQAMLAKSSGFQEDLEAARDQLQALRGDLTAAQREAAKQSSSMSGKLESAERLSALRKARQERCVRSASTEYDDTLRELKAKLAEKRQQLQRLKCSLEAAEVTIVGQKKALQEQAEELQRSKKQAVDSQGANALASEHLHVENARLASLVSRLQVELEAQTTHIREGEMRSSAAMQRLERQAKEAAGLREDLEICRRRLQNLEEERELASENVLDADERVQEMEAALRQLQNQVRESNKRDRAQQQKIRNLQQDLKEKSATLGSNATKAAELKAALDAANRKFAEEQDRMQAAQMLFEEEGKRIGQEYNELASVAEQLKEDLRAVQQLKDEAAARLKLSETQVARLSGREKASDAKIKELRAQVAALSAEQLREQDRRSQLIAEMTASVQAEEAGKLAAQKDARLARQKVAQMEVKIVETANARVKAEMQCQEVQAQLGATRRTLKLRQKESAKRIERENLEASEDMDMLSKLQATGLQGETLLFHCYDSRPATPEG